MLPLSSILFGACFQHMFVHLNVEHPQQTAISQTHTSFAFRSQLQSLESLFVEEQSALSFFIQCNFNQIFLIDLFAC